MSVSKLPAQSLGAYNKEVSSGAVEIDDALKAGHRVEPERGTQLCAEAVAAAEVRNTRSVTSFIAGSCILLADCPFPPRNSNPSSSTRVSSVISLAIQFSNAS